MNLGRIPSKTALLDPEREALIDIPNDRRMTFGALDERVRRLANSFYDELKLKKGDRVAILSKIASNTWRCFTPARAVALSPSRLTGDSANRRWLEFWKTASPVC